MNILLSFLGSIALMFLQLPTWLSWLGLPWVVLVLFYWILMAPQHINVGIACLVGFFLDIVYNTPIGENALILVLMVYFVTKFRGKIEPFDSEKIAIIIFCLMLVYQLIRYFF